METIKLELLEESENNPRQMRDKKADEDLKRSIEEDGLLTPLLVRKKGKKYQILAGHRRYGAIKSLGYKEVEVKITDVTKEKANELMIVENLQREDVHPMEEARAFQDMWDKLREQSYLPDACIKEIAKRMGKTTAYIAQNIILASLCNKIAQAFLKNHIDKKIALIYAKLNHEDQSTVWEANMINYPVLHHRTIEDLKRYIDQFKTRKMTEITWDIDDATFVGISIKGKEELEKRNGIPSLPACSACPKNTGVNADLFGTVVKKDARCTDRNCFGHKKRKHASTTRSSAKANWPFPYDFHEGAITSDWNDNETIKITGGSIEADKIKGQSLKFSTKSSKKHPAPIFVKSHIAGHYFDSNPPGKLLFKTVYVEYPEPNAERKSDAFDDKKWEREQKTREIRKRREVLMLKTAVGLKKDWTPHENIINAIATFMFHKQDFQSGPKLIALYEDVDYRTRVDEIRSFEWKEREEKVYPEFLKQITTMEHLQKLMYIIEATSDLGKASEGGYSKTNSVKMFISKVCNLDFKKTSKSVDKEAKEWYREEEGK